MDLGTGWGGGGTVRLCPGHSFISECLLLATAAATGRDTPHKQVFIQGSSCDCCVGDLGVKPIGAAATSQPERNGAQASSMEGKKP